MTCPFSMWGTITPLGPQRLDCMDTIFSYCKTRVLFEVRYSQFCLSPWTTGPLLLQGLKRCNKAEPKSTLNGSLFYSFTITLLSFCDLRTWNWVTLAGQACSFLVYVSLNSKRGKGQTSEEWFETYPGFSCSSTAMWNGWRSISSFGNRVSFCDPWWLTLKIIRPWMYKVPERMAKSPHLWSLGSTVAPAAALDGMMLNNSDAQGFCAITLPALAMVIDVFKVSSA